MAAQDFDVIIVGSGAAGLYASLCFPPDYRLAIITKAELKTGASDWAQGGIAAAIAPTDSPQLHYQDTLTAGAGLCEPDAVRFLVEKAPQAIQELVRLGVQFDRSGPDLALTLEAAHSRPRVLHAADTTGRAIVSTLMEQVLARPQVEIFPQAIAVSLDCEPATGRCRGVSVLHQDRLQWFRARVVLLATGGGGQVFAQTTNPKVSTGDGIALAWRCGAILRDLEFFQFHPTALTKPGVPHFLISEAVRGEGAHLRDKAGRRFLFDYHPQGELAPRDVVSRAIFQHLQATETDPTQATVFLDLSAIEPERIRRRFPNIIERCQKWGVDVFREPIPVAPAAHYWMGGVQTDLACRTSVPGLWAIGEVTSTGVHGANRLASNSLLECIVFADQLASLELPPPWAFPQQRSYPVAIDLEADLPQMQAIHQAIPSLMWQAAGICRHADGLRPAITQVEQWQAQWQDLASSRFMAQIPPGQDLQFAMPTVTSQLQYWAETRNLLDIAALILKSALFRPESRGGHFRLDYPQARPEWQLHTQIQQGQWSTQEIQP
jgi:L-aspartate oxidase